MARSLRTLRAETLTALIAGEMRRRDAELPEMVTDWRWQLSSSTPAEMTDTILGEVPAWAALATQQGRSEVVCLADLDYCDFKFPGNWDDASVPKAEWLPEGELPSLIFNTLAMKRLKPYIASGDINQHVYGAFYIAIPTDQRGTPGDAQPTAEGTQVANGASRPIYVFQIEDNDGSVSCQLTTHDHAYVVEQTGRDSLAGGRSARRTLVGVLHVVRTEGKVFENLLTSKTLETTLLG